MGDSEEDITLTNLFDFEVPEEGPVKRKYRPPKIDNPGCPLRCGLCCRMVACRVEGMSPKELHWLTTRGIFVYPNPEGFYVVYRQDCVMLEGVQCRLHDGAKPEVCIRGACLHGEPWFDAAVKFYFPDLLYSSENPRISSGGPDIARRSPR